MGVGSRKALSGASLVLFGLACRQILAVLGFALVSRPQRIRRMMWSLVVSGILALLGKCDL